MGEDVYSWFSRPLDELDFTRSLKDHQKEIVRACLTYRYQIIAADMGLGKSLCAIEVMERSGDTPLYVGPRSAIESVKREAVKWGSRPFEISTYEGVVNHPPQSIPSCVIFDECSSLKTPTALRTTAAQRLADRVRDNGGVVVLMSGSPTAKRPTDIWAQAEIAFPGFVVEGSFKSFEERYANIVEQETTGGITFHKIESWKEDEVAEIPRRLRGLMRVYRKEDYLNLPPREYKVIQCKPHPKMLRAAKAIAEVAPNTVTALTWLRALSSGFQYEFSDSVGACDVCHGTCVTEVHDSTMCDACEGSGVSNIKTRMATMVDTPKRAALEALFEECGNRIVVGASFQGSIDIVTKICQDNGFECCVVDGRGWRVEGKSVDPLTFWAEHDGKVAWVGNPASCRFGITLTEANVLVNYDSSFSAEHRLQFNDRIYRIGQERSVTVYDLVHLPVDQLVLDTLNHNRKLELLTLGQIHESLEINIDTSGPAEYAGGMS